MSGSELRNLIYLFADQWRYSAMEGHGEAVQTPSMARFREEATDCPYCFSSFPVCSPHRASLLTGKYPLSAGFFTNCKTGLDLRLQDAEICISDVLHEAGYHTAYIGKWHLDEPEMNHEEEPLSGARAWDAYTPPGPRRHGFDFWYSYGAWDAHMRPHYWKDSPEMLRHEGWSVEHETEVCLDYLRQAKQRQEEDGRPFALFLSWNPPHSPYEDLPEELLEAYPTCPALPENVPDGPYFHHTGEAGPQTRAELEGKARCYYAAITGIDSQFGRILNTLEELGLKENSLIVLSADHGDMMGSQGLMGKHVWYDESIRIPFLLRAPWVPGSLGQELSQPLASPDQMPTLLDLLGLDLPETVEGRSVAAQLRSLGTTESELAAARRDLPPHLLRGPEALPDWLLEEACFLEACPGSTSLYPAIRDAGLEASQRGWRGLRSRRYCLVLDLGYRPELQPQLFFYDLDQDPLQQSPLHLEGEALRKALGQPVQSCGPEAPQELLLPLLSSACLGWMEAMGDPFREVWIEQVCHE